MNERDWQRGNNDAWEQLLSDALRHLPKRFQDKHLWRQERGRAVAKLREVCERFGDNDWDDTLSLSDVIEKHLLRHLEAR